MQYFRNLILSRDSRKNLVPPSCLNHNTTVELLHTKWTTLCCRNGRKPRTAQVKLSIFKRLICCSCWASDHWPLILGAPTKQGSICKQRYISFQDCQRQNPANVRRCRPICHNTQSGTEIHLDQSSMVWFQAAGAHKCMGWKHNRLLGTSRAMYCRVLNKQC